MPALSLANVVSWWVQVAVIAVAGLLLPLALRLTLPRPRLYYLRALLLLCLALPLLQPWALVPAPGVQERHDTQVTAAGEGGSSDPREAREAVVATSAPVSTPRPSSQLERMTVAVYAGGLSLRLGWLAVGLLSLRRLRRSSSPLLPRPAALDAAEDLAGASAEFRVSPRVVHPVTFGVRRPVVLVPPAFVSFGPSQQTAVATHELLHVRRRDWLRTVGDQLVLCVCWFHPALWWLVERIDLAVEQVVDRAAVSLVGDRKPYLKALLDLAAAGSGPLPGPASAFANRSHLSERVALLLREVTMSRLRMVVSFAGIAAVLGAGASYVVRAYPLTATQPAVLSPALPSPALPTAAVPTPAAAANNPQSPVPGVPTPPPATEWPKLVQPGPLVYPPAALGEKRGGIVLFRVALDQAGQVTEAEVSHSSSAWDGGGRVEPASDDLVAAAAAAVRAARFAPLSRPWPRYSLAVRFDPETAKVDWLPIPPPPPPPPPPGATPGGAPGRVPTPGDFTAFDERVGELTSQLEAEPANIKARYGLAMLYWERGYRDGSLPEGQRREYIRLGLREADLALEGDPQFVEALVSKSLLLRAQALLEQDPQVREALTGEADKLREEALRLRSVRKEE